MEPIDIMLIEDNEGDILLTTEALLEGKIANDIKVVKDGYEALQYLEKNENVAQGKIPDLILLDINLPKLNGHEVLKEIKTAGHLKHLPVIILSTSSSQDDVMSCYQNYANCYITKPNDANDYFRVISSIKNFWMSVVQLPKNH